MDSLVAHGTTVVLSEIPELIGLEDALYNRCVDQTTEGALRAAVRRHAEYLSSDGTDPTSNELCEFNYQGGIETLEQKARISVLKGGSSAITGFVDYGSPPMGGGLCIMDGPAMSDFVVTGLLGAGAHLMVNCCGSGPANAMPVIVGADGAPAIMPILKCSGGSSYAADPGNRIDFDAGILLESPDKSQEIAGHLVSRLVLTASGERTLTEGEQLFWLNFPFRYHQA
jgi:altronate hydrolase